jgi:diguanylate cyclase (GGDEF)-like protein
MGSSHEQLDDAPMPPGRAASAELVERARALLPRVWSGDDVSDELRTILNEAAAERDLEAECAARFVEVAEASIRGDQGDLLRTAGELVERSRLGGLPLWESRGRHYLARAHLSRGEEAAGIEELVTAEVLTDEHDEPSVLLTGAINGIAATYMLLGLFEDSARLFERMASMLDRVNDPWAHRALLYNRLLNDASWALALEQFGEPDEARERLRLASRQVAADHDVLVGSSIEGDVDLLSLFTELMTGQVTLEAGRERLAELTRGEHQLESESFAHFGVATILTEEGRFEEARAEVQAGVDDLHPIEGERVHMALRWLAARIAVLEDPDHVGLQQAWRYAKLMTDKVRELRLRRRDAVLDRLHIRRLRREHDRVERASLEDALTGVANRRRLDRERTHLGTTTDAGWTTVIYLDLDGFKQVNDTFGHDLGDDVLKIIADLLRTSVRNHDLVGRYGGDEFVVIAHHCDPDDATTLGERIVSTVRHHPWDQLHPSLQLTVSAGVAVTDDAYAHLFPHADDLLYTAKQTGRDRAIIRTVDAGEVGAAATEDPRG